MHQRRAKVVVAVVVMVVVVVFVGLAVIVIVIVIVIVAVVVIGAKQPGAGEIDREAEAGDRYGLGEFDRHGIEKSGNRLIGDQQRDDRQDQRAGEPREIAELARPEGETGIASVAASVGISQGRQQQRAGMGAHVDAIGDERHRAEHPAADDFQHHHRGAEPDHRPGFLLARIMVLAEEDVVVKAIGGTIAHFRASFQIGPHDIEQLPRGVPVERAGMFLVINKMCQDVVLDHLGHQPGHGAARGGDEMHDLLAARLALQRPLDSLDLPANAPDAGEEFLFFVDGVGHAEDIAYPPYLFNADGHSH